MPKINPYKRLLGDIKKHCHEQKYRHKRDMFYYPKDTVAVNSWKLNDLYERTQAAEQLGYDVGLEVKDGNLHVFYKKKELDIPFTFQY